MRRTVLADMKVRKGAALIGELAVWYLFLAGVGAGAVLVAAVLEQLTPFEVRCVAATTLRSASGASATYRYAPGAAASAWRTPAISWAAATIPQPQFQRFFAPAYGAGMAAVLVGMFCLLADLGRPDRLLQLLFAPTLSFIAVGVYLLLALTASGLVLCAVWLFGATRLPRWLVAAARIVAALSAIAVMAYTGLLLCTMPAIPFWNTPWVPLLFVASDISAGIGLVVAAVILTGGDGPFRTTLLRIKRWDAVALVAEAVCLVLLLAVAFWNGPTAEASASMILRGPVAAPFWIMVVGMGLLFPFAAARASQGGGSRLMLAVSGALLISCFFLRWCVVQAGMAPDMAVAVMAALGSAL